MSKRTKNSARNIAFGFISKFIGTLAPFIVRSALIQIFGSEYLGLNSLFTSILQVLNLAELGFSSAIVYSMYAPIAERDQRTICALMNLYKKIYRVIGFVVLASGLFILPFLHSFIRGSSPEGISIYAIYILYLLNTVFTYFLFAYKSALLAAHQRSDLISKAQVLAQLLQLVLQLFALLCLRNFYIFVAVQIISTVTNNLLISHIADKHYPNYTCSGELSKIEKRNIRKRVAGLVVQKICATTRNSVDSIFISVFLGLNMVAIYSNYYSIMNAIIGLMGVIASSIIASVGNSIATETEAKNYADMKKFNFLYMQLSGWVTIFLACLYQPVMQLWMGSDLLLPNLTAFLFCLYFYSLKIGDIRWVYVEARGLWYESRFRAIAESILNITLNVILGYFFGVNGIIIATLVSLLLINFAYGSHILFTHYFKHQKISEYFSSQALYALITALICGITYFCCSYVSAPPLPTLIIRCAICLVVPPLLYYLVYCRTEIYNLATRRVIRRLRSARKQFTGLTKNK